MTIEKFLQHMNQGLPAPEGTQVRDTMSRLSEEARKITMKMNSSYREQEEIRSLFAELIGRAVDETFALFPPFYTDCWKKHSYREKRVYQCRLPLSRSGRYFH